MYISSKLHVRDLMKLLEKENGYTELILDLSRRPQYNTQREITFNHYLGFTAFLFHLNHKALQEVNS